MQKLKRQNEQTAEAALNNIQSAAKSLVKRLDNL